ncbi:uncharacterized protein [Eurosta solidaginis]|uniref:uncharacterized protein n=1 Tax=Eurosta solidaginis TaxID=178769 RepID=UPI003530E0B0
MNLIFTAFALISAVSADGKHLSRQYLPPVQYYSDSVPAAKTEDFSDSDRLLDVKFDSDINNAELSDGYSGYQPKFEYTQQAEEASYSGGHDVTYVHGESPAFEKFTAADAISYSIYDNDKAHWQYQPADTDEDQQQHHVDASYHAADFSNVGLSYGYNLGSQDAGTYDLDHKSFSNSYDHSVDHAESPVEEHHISSASFPAASHDAVTQYVSSAGAYSFSTKYSPYGGYIY